MKAKVLPGGRIALPARLQRRDGIRAGQTFDIQRLGRGDYRLTRYLARPNDGVVDWLLACPAKGYFAPIGSESTDAVG